MEKLEGGQASRATASKDKYVCLLAGESNTAASTFGIKLNKMFFGLETADRKQKSEAAAQPSKVALRRFGEDQKKESWPEKRLSYLKSCSFVFASSENWTNDQRNCLSETA